MYVRKHVTQYTVLICQVTDRNMLLVISTSQSCQDIYMYMYMYYQHVMIYFIGHNIGPTNIS